jgi:hypothetical protein
MAIMTRTAGELVRVVVDPGTRARDADLVEQFDRPVLGVAPGHAAMRPEQFGELESDRVDRVQRGERVLEDHRDLVGPDPPALVLPQLQQVDTAIADLATGDVPGRRLQDAHDRLSGHRFAAARLTQDGQGLAGVQPETRPVHRLGDAVPGTELDVQVVDLEQRCAGIESG